MRMTSFTISVMKLGIAVWQDFIFACSTYPAFDVAFMENVRREAEDNVRRIRHHSCLRSGVGIMK